MEGDKELARSQMIKVHRFGQHGLEIVEVDLVSAAQILEQAYARAGLVVNKKTGEVIDKIDSRVEEIFIVEMLEGG
jgi:uncharacterized SAM-dependent methyltransferase